MPRDPLDPALPLAEVLKRMKALNAAERERKKKGELKPQVLERKEIPREWREKAAPGMLHKFCAAMQKQREDQVVRQESKQRVGDWVEMTDEYKELVENEETRKMNKKKTLLLKEAGEKPSRRLRLTGQARTEKDERGLGLGFRLY